MRELICIVCPKGCHITVENEGKDSFSASGYSCQRGKEYAFNELHNPVRTITTTVVVENASYERLPVKTSVPVNKGMVFDICRFLNGIKVKAPISIGDVVVKNVLDSGADIIATRSMTEL